MNENTSVLIFPENITDLTSQILEKHNLKDGEGSIKNAKILSDLLRKIAHAEVHPKELPSLIKESFGGTKAKAEKMAKDIELNILSKTETPEEARKKTLGTEPTQEAEPKKPGKKTNPTEGQKKEDPYREFF